MSRHNVDIHQLHESSGAAYMNVMEPAGGGIGVWTNCVGMITALLQGTNTPTNVMFLQFDSEISLEDFLLNQGQTCKIIWRSDIQVGYGPGEFKK